jgi:Tfp pilus assembly protein PilN
VKGLAVIGTAAYLLLIAGLVTAGVLQWNQIRGLEQRQAQQEPDFKDAMQLKRELTAVRESLNPSGNALEMLRQLGEAMPDTVTLDSFSYRFQDSLKLRGTATQADAVYDLVQKLKYNSSFVNAKVDSVGENSSGGGVNWQVTVPFQSASTL